MAAPIVPDRVAEQMLALARDGRPWDQIAARFNLNDSQARRAVREYQRRRKSR